MRTMRLGGEDADKARRVATDDQRLCTFYAKERRADGDCSFMEAHGYWTYSHTDRFGKIDHEWGHEKGRRGSECERESLKRGHRGHETATRLRVRTPPASRANGRRNRSSGYRQQRRRRATAAGRGGGSSETGVEAAVAPESVHVSG